MNEQEPVAGNRRAVAVIAVHGVGDQKPFETARRIGDLLQELPLQQRGLSADPPPPCASPGPESPNYYPFHEEKLRIAVNPVVTRVPEGGEQAEEQTDAQTGSATLGPFNRWVTTELEKTPPKWRGAKQQRDPHPASAYDISTEFMKRQLACYAGDKPEDTYETIRIEGSRAPRNGTPPVDVHIYELYWADLSRLKAGIFSIFTELYQLLFHLSSLGVHAINAASLDHPAEASWRWLRRSQSCASAILTLPLPVFNLLMLWIFGVILGLNGLHAASDEVQFGIVTGCFAASFLALTGILLWRRMRSSTVSRRVWLGAFVLWFGLGVVTGLLVTQRYRPTAEYPRLYGRLPVFESAFLFAIAGALILWLLSQYNRRRPGALRWGIVLALAALLAGVPGFYSLHSRLAPFALASTVPQFWMREFEVAYHAATLSWVLFFLFAAANGLLGLLALVGERGAKRDLAVRSRWTGWLMLSMPSFIFLVVTVISWGLLAKAAEKWVPEFPYYPLVSWIPATCPKEMVDWFLNGPVEIMLPVALFFAGVAALPAIWGMAPVVFSEVVPPPPFKAMRQSRSAPLGQWLSLAYRSALLLSGLLIYLLMILLVPGGALLRTIAPSIAGIRYIGVFSGALFGLLFFSRGSLKKLALGFRPALDLLLDVDNWLREHPLDSNPKARICGRYISLLRYIANWRSSLYPDGYDKVVVIAHSQGTVITADLLRFLHARVDGSQQRWRDLDPQLAKLGDNDVRKQPITFFTMGCPLRQLYGLRFPYLYGWARHQNDSPMSRYTSDDLKSFNPLPKPDPHDLGVAHWINAFRSGDYVGRHLWRTDDCSYLWLCDARNQPTPPPEVSRSTDSLLRTEFCLGAGAHTHYWDETAPVIASTLDSLIAAP